jgi:hypothetical protein
MSSTDMKQQAHKKKDFKKNITQMGQVEVECGPAQKENEYSIQ